MFPVTVGDATVKLQVAVISWMKILEHRLAMPNPDAVYHAVYLSVYQSGFYPATATCEQ